MIKIVSSSKNIVHYACSCGTNGRCIIRPLGHGDTVVMSIECAACGANGKTSLMQESNTVIENPTMVWSLVLTNDIISVD